MAYAPYANTRDFLKDNQAEIALGVSLLASGGSNYFQQRGIALSGSSSMYAARYNAAKAIEEGNYQSMLIRRAARQRNSSDFAQFSGKSGVLAEEGGWLEVLSANYGASEADAQRVIERAHQTAYLEIERGKQAKRMAKFQRKAVLISGLTRAAGAIASLGLGLGAGAGTGSNLLSGTGGPSGNVIHYGGGTPWAEI